MVAPWKRRITLPETNSSQLKTPIFPASYVSLQDSIIKDIQVLILLSMAIKVSFPLGYGRC